MADDESTKPLRILQIASGEAHTLALTETGKVFAWGRGFFGRLGTGREADESIPVFVPIGFDISKEETDEGNENVFEKEQSWQTEAKKKIWAGVKVVAVAAGAYHSLALADDGAVWSWGHNLYGQLGRDDENNSIPHLVTGWGEHQRVGTVSAEAASHHHHNYQAAEDDVETLCKSWKIVAVEAGGMMSCAIDQAGTLWMWGNCPVPTHKRTNNEPFSLSLIPGPQAVTCLEGLRVLKVACGNEHILTLIEVGEGTEGHWQVACYAWGSNTYGQLGLGDTNSRASPQHVKALDQHLVGSLSHIACGAFHSAVLSHQERWRAEHTGPVGISGENIAGVKKLTMADSYRDSTWRSLCWTFGLGENGQLGHGISEKLALPKLVEGLPDQENLAGVACGLFHTVVYTETGAVWVWGMEGGLGLCPGIGPPGTGAGDALSPLEVVPRSYGLGICSGEKQLACGAAHTVVVASGGSKIFSWGRGQSGVLGTGDLSDKLLPCQVIWPPHCVGDENVNRDKGKSVTDFLLTKDITNTESSSEPAEMEMRLNMADKEIVSLRTELSATKQYAAGLHFALFGLQENSKSTQYRNALLDLEKTIENASYADLVRLNEFYHSMRSRVKEVMLQKKVEEICRQRGYRLQSPEKGNY